MFCCFHSLDDITRLNCVILISSPFSRPCCIDGAASIEATTKDVRGHRTIVAMVTKGGLQDNEVMIITVVRPHILF